MRVTVIGMANAQEQFRRLLVGTRSLAAAKATIGTRIPWGYGEEYGHHRKSGKLARRAGGVYYLTRAKDEVLSNAARDVSAGLSNNRHTAPGKWIITMMAGWIRRLARSYAPVGTGAEGDTHPGKLRKSIHVERGAR